MNLLHAVRSKNYFKNKTAPKWMNESISVRFFCGLFRMPQRFLALLTHSLFHPKAECYDFCFHL